MDDLISRKVAIDWIKGWFDTDKHYHPYSKGKTIPTCEVMDILERVPSAEQKSGRYVDLSERVTATYYDDEYEEWSEKTVTVEELLDTACEDYTVVEMPSAEPEPAIPLSWIEAQIEWLKSLDNAFSALTATQISAMVDKWKGEQK